MSSKSAPDVNRRVVLLGGVLSDLLRLVRTHSRAPVVRKQGPAVPAPL